MSRSIGTLTLVVALFGLWYNALSFTQIYSDPNFESILGNPVPYFRQAFYTLSAIWVLCYVALIWCGVQFLRLDTSWWWLLAAISAIELIFSLGLGRMWLHPTWGMSIGAASGVSSGGLVPQLFTLFPIWAPVLMWFTHRTLRRT